MHLSFTIGLKTALQRWWKRWGGGVKRGLTDPLYLVVWGPRVPGSRLFDCVVQNTQRAQWKAALLWDGQLSPSGSNITVTHTSTPRVITTQKSGCVVPHQTERNVHALARSAGQDSPWAQHQVSELKKIKSSKTTTGLYLNDSVQRSYL